LIQVPNNLIQRLIRVLILGPSRWPGWQNFSSKIIGLATS
jgi:hypothetical protein